MKTDLFDQLEALPWQFPGLDAIPNDIQYLMGCRGFPQFCSTLRTIADPLNFCVFCNPALTKNQPLLETSQWYVKESDFPVKGTQKSWLIIPRSHVLTTEEDLTDRDGAQVFSLFREACSKLKIPGGGLVLRFGQVRYHVGTIPHAHFNILLPEDNTDCVATLGKPIDDRRTNYERLMGHRGDLNRNGGREWLFSPEGIEATKQ